MSIDKPQHTREAPGVTGVTVVTADTGRLIADQAAERHQGRCLLAAGYNRTLWQPCLRHAFPGARQARLHDAVDHLRLLRNQIAHQRTGPHLGPHRRLHPDPRHH